MDAFYASVEQLTRPTLADRPVLVGGAGPRGVVAGASYQARVFGARSAMPMAQARRACPHATVLPPRFELYKALSAIVMTVLGEAAPVLEPVSLDEAFLEPPALAGADAAEVTAFGTALRAAVRERTGLPASVGAGSGKQLAKIASELAKPDGLRVVAPEEERTVLDPLPVRSLWGIGPVSEAALHRLGVTTIGQFAAMDGREVGGVLGSAVGTELHRLARGIDDRPVAPRGAAKQVSAETTFETDLTTMTDVHAAVARMAEAAHRRLVASGRAARTVTVKARTADFATSSRSETTAYPSTDLGTLTAVAQRLARTAVGEGGIRLIGVSLSGLDDSPPPALFEAVASADGWTAVAAGSEAPPPVSPPEVPHREPAPSAPWRAGDDVAHTEYGHGWVQGAGHGRVTVRFETRATGPGSARTLSADDPALTRADPMDSWTL
ncbi:MAG: DNA polymerase IV [Pseudonocardia sp. SCN 73-27]|uniref:DNA polymerase IV n=1 Tax=unclassified Pseudonocardia TaxID=2619320 RepID=UPI00086F0E7E|nr:MULTISPECIES: DNA polymerase IV [unclassified Pseudonocardia]ODU21554.1 MAG: DNA polymerase IV [Pseudonocardia sp. SCN 72-51]ODV01253.1 MAG: DNA polymerase IV [Pseudonocardia sp. SCN 73-27]